MNDDQPTCLFAANGDPTSSHFHDSSATTGAPISGCTLHRSRNGRGCRTEFDGVTWLERTFQHAGAQTGKRDLSLAISAQNP